MLSYVIIGMTSVGKTPFTKRMVMENDQKPCIIFDVNNEYGEYDKYGNKSLGLTNDVSQPRCRYTGDDFKAFLEIVRKKRGCNVIFEEATGFLKGSIGKDVVKMVIRKAHDKNNLIFVFHSIRSVPPALLDFTDYVILFPVGDSYDEVRKKDRRLIEPFLEVMTYPQKAPIVIKWLGT